ncbi:CLUMA_CG013510, isoform A [Clunio marinus]|uniref:5-formyltetrahydrofolate cyclo-ligase n=1 Tax=Clunio marinus TaxID=568069 RepID=A0A1J1IJ23_9DIPT|nr:CLUMA_CG013510, isoform A [Clunio marinus]
MPFYESSRRISIYLSTEREVDTVNILERMFNDKEVFIPTYSGSVMDIVKLYDLNDYKNLPLTKWNIKQPKENDRQRENPLLTAPLDLILMPGVAFTRNGGRMGHGMGYYDKYLKTYFNRFPDRQKINKTLLVGLAFQEQIVEDDQLPLDPHDYPLDLILTSD